MPRTNWLLLAAVAVLPLLVPPSAVAWELLPLEDRLALEATEISSAKVCGASECRELSDPEAATALAVGPTRGADAPVRGLPWYTSTLTIPAEERGEVRVSVTVVPSAGLMRVGDGVWVNLPSESKEAYAKLTAGLTPRPARTLPSVGEARRGPERGHPGAGERRLERLDRRAGRRRASGAHGGVAAQDPPPPRVDAASGARGTRSSVTNRPRPVVLAAASCTSRSSAGGSGATVTPLPLWGAAQAALRSEGQSSCPLTLSGPANRVSNPASRGRDTPSTWGPHAGVSGPVRRKHHSPMSDGP